MNLKKKFLGSFGSKAIVLIKKLIYLWEKVILLKMRKFHLAFEGGLC